MQKSDAEKARNLKACEAVKDIKLSCGHDCTTALAFSNDDNFDTFYCNVCGRSMRNGKEY